jgi:hypothetical protein
VIYGISIHVNRQFITLRPAYSTKWLIGTVSDFQKLRRVQLNERGISIIVGIMLAATFSAPALAASRGHGNGGGGGESQKGGLPALEDRVEADNPDNCTAGTE